MKFIFPLLILALFTRNSFAQSADDQINLFLDCQTNCYEDYIKQTLTIVNYVRDVTEAEVYLLMTSQRTGSGGREYQLQAEGQEQYEGQENKLIFTVDANATDDEIRQLMLKNIVAILSPYIASTPSFQKLSLSVQSEQAEVAAPEEDPWNNWVYSVGINAWFNGEDSYKSINANASANARRVTENWNIGMSARYSNDFSIYEFGDNKIETNIINYGFYTHAIKSLGGKWGAGVSSDVFSSTYSNLRLAVSNLAAIEYNIFPYAESSTRELRVNYRIGQRYNWYQDTTIYFKTEENLFTHNLGISYETTNKWGGVDASLFASQYLHDLNLYRISLYTGLNIRIVKGLNFRVSGNVSYIRDQITLAKNNTTEEDVLLQIRELSKSYSFWGNFGISYTFGSIYNNVVNPRFGGGL